MQSSLRAAAILVAVLATIALATTRKHEPARPLVRAPRLHSAAARALRDDRPVDLNTAQASELTLLPGVGPKLAERIVEARTARGGFRSVDELDAVRGIGPATLSRLRPLVLVTDRRAATPTR